MTSHQQRLEWEAQGIRIETMPDGWEIPFGLPGLHGLDAAGVVLNMLGAVEREMWHMRVDTGPIHGEKSLAVLTRLHLDAMRGHLMHYAQRQRIEMLRRSAEPQRWLVRRDGQLTKIDMEGDEG